MYHLHVHISDTLHALHDASHILHDAHGALHDASHFLCSLLLTPDCYVCALQVPDVCYHGGQRSDWGDHHCVDHHYDLWWLS